AVERVSDMGLMLRGTTDSPGIKSEERLKKRGKIPICTRDRSAVRCAMKPDPEERVKMSRRRSLRRRRSERGGIIVESALALPLFLLVVFGSMEFGLAFRRSLTLTNSTR